MRRESQWDNDRGFCNEDSIKDCLPTFLVASAQKNALPKFGSGDSNKFSSRQFGGVRRTAVRHQEEPEDKSVTNSVVLTDESDSESRSF